MKRVRIAVIVFTVVLSLVAFGQVALAGEWAPGHGYNGASGVANSECVYNGRDDIDDEDNALWALSPAGGLVQSGGQIIALQRTTDVQIPLPQPGVQGEACNGHLNPHKP